MIPEQVAIDVNAWEWFLNLNPEQQANTLLLICSPGIIAIIGTILFISSLRQIYTPDDKQTFGMAMVLASIFGVLTLLFMKNIINDALNYELYKAEALFAAAVITPIMNHIVFRLITVALHVLYYIGNSVPEQHSFYWLAIPVKKLATLGYFTVTGKRLTKTVVNEETGESFEITQITERER